MTAVIIAGGKGTRLSSITNNEIPKPMVRLLSKPILEYQIEALRRNGIVKIILIIGYLHEIIENHFNDGSAFGVSIEYIVEKEPLGSAGALFFLRGKITEPFFVVFGDLIFDVFIRKMLAFHNEHTAVMTLLVHPNAHPYDSDLVVVDNTCKVLRIDSKNTQRDYFYKNLVNAGIFILNPFALDVIGEVRRADFEKDIIQPLIIQTNSVYGYKTTEYVKDVGTPERLAATENDIMLGIVSGKNQRKMQKCIFLDRDGTINKYIGLLSRIDSFELEDGVIDAIKIINKSEYLAIVITNQPVIARNLCSIQQLDAIHNKMETLLGNEGAYIDDISYCPHHPDKGYPEENYEYKKECTCRKPKIGMIEECANKYNIDLSRSWMIGDSTIDIQTGINAGLKTVLLHTGQAGMDHKWDVRSDFEADSMIEAIYMIVEVRDEGL